MTAAVCIGGVDKKPSPSVRVLRIQIDSKFKWGPHLKFIQGKIATQTLALSRLTASTWERALRRRDTFIAPSCDRRLPLALPSGIPHMAVPTARRGSTNSSVTYSKSVCER